MGECEVVMGEVVIGEVVIGECEVASMHGPRVRYGCAIFRSARVPEIPPGVGRTESRAGERGRGPEGVA